MQTVVFETRVGAVLYCDFLRLFEKIPISR